MSDEPLIWIDGSPEKALPLPDRGVDFGDGLFETLLVLDGRPQWPELHLLRLQKGLMVLGFPDCLQNVQADIEQICQTIAATDWVWCALRVTVTRGGGPRGYAPPIDTVPRIVLMVTRLERDCAARMPAARLCRADITLARQPALAGIKHLNRLEQVMASAQASASGFDEALLCDDAGTVISVAAGNLFAVFETEILTPILHNAGVAGTRRHLVIEHWAPQLGLKVREADLSVENLAAAQEVFYTNTLVGIRSVASIEDHGWPEGAKTLALSEHYLSELG